MYAGNCTQKNAGFEIGWFTQISQEIQNKTQKFENAYAFLDALLDSTN
jgi:hypothetical protein